MLHLFMSLCRIASFQDAEAVAEELRQRHGLACAHYHADMDPGQREGVHQRWSQGRVQILVGTVAFGMGEWVGGLMHLHGWVGGPMHSHGW